MPGLVPGIHVFVAARKDVDGRDKPGHDVDDWVASNYYATRLAAPAFTKIASRQSIISDISSRVTLSAGMKRSASGCGELMRTPSASASATIAAPIGSLQVERQQQSAATDFAEAVPSRQFLQLAFQKQPGVRRRFQEFRL